MRWNKFQQEEPCMKTKMLIVVILVGMVLPPVSHGFGLLRYIYDATINQLGLDRGPVPKVMPKPVVPGPHSNCLPADRPYRTQNIYIQAEGF
jgi:hypothetical protein